jgi:hypothetical protein
MRIFYFLALLLLSCNIDNTGFPEASRSINESKSNGVFLYSLKPNKSVINLRNQKDTILEAWVEYEWKHESDRLFFRKVQKDSARQLLIHFRHLPAYQEKNFDIWLSQGERYFAGSGVASQRLEYVNLDSPIHVAFIPNSIKETTVLDSFKLSR